MRGATMWRINPPPDKTPTTKSASKPPKSTLLISSSILAQDMRSHDNTGDDGFRRYPIGLIAKALPRNFVQKASWHSSGKLPPGPLLIVMIPSSTLYPQNARAVQYPQDINDAHVRISINVESDNR